MKLKWLLRSLFLLSFVFIINAQPISFKNGVVASAHELASNTGIEILKQGGNAVDAAIAAAMVLSVVEPYASGIGGGGFLIIKMNGKDPITIDYRETAPSKISIDKYYSNQKKFNTLTTIGVHSVAIPGTLKGLKLALDKYGSLPFSEILKPAIRAALNGFEISQTMSDIIVEQYEVVSNFEETAKLYLKEGLPNDVGDKIINTNLAKTYQQLSNFGIDLFYKGEIAAELVRTVNEFGGNIIQEDLIKYTAQMKEPIKGTYKGFEIISSAPPSGGGTHLIQLLNILECFDLQKLGHNSDSYIHLFSEALKIVHADKEKFMCDPDFYFVPVDKLISKDYAKKCSDNINMDSAMTDWKSNIRIDNEPGSTTSLSVADKDHNMVTITQSINLFFGSGITIPSTGILLNNHMNNFEPSPGHVNSIEPNKRPVSSIAPTIVMKNGKPVLTFGSPGGSRIIGTLAQVIINMIEFGMSFEEAIVNPRFNSINGKLHLENRISNETIEKLKLKGHKIEVHSAYDKYFGGVQGVLINNESGVLHGAADPRREGSVKGY